MRSRLGRVVSATIYATGAEQITVDVSLTQVENRPRVALLQFDMDVVVISVAQAETLRDALIDALS